MKVVFEKDLLVQGCMKIGKAITGKANKDILKGIKIIAQGNMVILTGTDMDITITTRLKAEVLEKGNILVDYKLLNEIIRKMSGNEISFETTETELIIRCNKSQISLLLINDDAYPDIVNVNKNLAFTIDNYLLKELVQGVAFATAEDNSKAILQGIYFAVTKSVLNIVALDGYRLAYKKQNIDLEEDFEVVVDKKHFLEVVKLLDNEGETNVIISNNHILFSTGSTIIICRLLEGKYVNYKSLISSTEDCPISIEVSKNALLSSIERATIFNEEKSFIVLSISNDKMKVNARSSKGSLNEEVNIEPILMNQEGLEIAFNSRYLIDVLKNSNSENIRMFFKGSVSPCIVKEEDNEDAYYLILPVRMR